MKPVSCVPRPLLPRLAAFEECLGWWSTSFTIERVCSSSARKSLQQRKHTQRGHAERCSTARLQQLQQVKHSVTESLFKCQSSPFWARATSTRCVGGRSSVAERE